MTDKYEIIARRFRPGNFEEVAGQEHVTTTLKNAISQKKIGQSYLFSGPRGVGKTTLARILVKSLNCENGPTPVPCNKCRFCKEVNESRSLDYMEIDGASNRGIDQIREINDSIKYASPEQKYRIFVIDEVHMLTIEAFNALLKNLEEPPPKVIFVFCTTEVHRVPATIRSRCQHYSFKAFNIESIVAQLIKIIEELKADGSRQIEFEEEAVFNIAKAAGGSMRDSQNILEQVLAYGDNALTAANVLDVLGQNPSEVYFDFIRHLHQERLKDNYALIHGLMEAGKDIRQFIFDLIQNFSILLYIREGIDDLNLLEISKHDYDQLSHFKDEFSRENIFLLNDICFEFLKELRITTDEKVTVNLMLIKLHRYKTLISPEMLKAEMLKISAEVEKEEASPPPEKQEAPPAAEKPAEMEEAVVETTPKTIDTITGLDYNMVCDDLKQADPRLYDVTRHYEFSDFQDNVIILRMIKDYNNNAGIDALKNRIVSAFEGRYPGKISVRIEESSAQGPSAEDSLENARKVFGGRVVEPGEQT